MSKHLSGSKKLTLNKKTVARLGEEELSNVAGGRPKTTDNTACGGTQACTHSNNPMNCSDIACSDKLA